MLHQSTFPSQTIPTGFPMAPKQDAFEDLVTKKQLALHLQFSVSFIEKLMLDEGLPHLKVGRAVRFRLNEVREWLNRRRLP